MRFQRILLTHRNRSKQYLRFLDYKQDKPVVAMGTVKYKHNAFKKMHIQTPVIQFHNEHRQINN